MGKLDVGSADDLDRLDNGVGILLQSFLELRTDSQHGGRAVAVPGVHPHGVYIFDETDRYHLVLGIPDHFQLQLFPAQNRLLHQHLVHQACRKAPGGNGF